MSLLASVLETLRPGPRSTVAWALRNYLNQRLEALGQMTQLRIDSANKQASLDLELKAKPSLSMSPSAATN